MEGKEGKEEEGGRGRGMIAVVKKVDVRKGKGDGREIIKHR